ncbi:peroxiredoxin family protein [Bacteroides timonensis]|uniref:peroxiredoxin family protein n=1 Tax=Bacteroides timonensis TaxID=1470345 RepID=UPI0005C5E5E9|nr:TlpA disulfide reductase family protein [Bacteroides timonensis]
MKRLSLTVLLTSVLLISSCTTAPIFQIDATTQGILAGDTLIFTHHSLPDWKETSCDTLVATKKGEFSFSKIIAETGLYNIAYHPSQTEPPIYCNRGFSFYARPGDHLKVKGDIEFFPAMQKEGGMYDDPRLQRILTLDDSITVEMNKLYRKLRHFADLRGTPQANPDSVIYYNQAYRQCHSKELSEALRNFYNTADDSEYAALEYMQSLHAIPYKEAQERFARFTPEIQSSTTGKKIEQLLKVMKNIEPGNTPSAFTVTADDSSRISLSDYQGKYLLIYHWGYGCPGTTWVHPRLLKLYEEYHDKGFEILGFTGDKRPQDLSGNTEAAALYFPPWPTVYTEQKENSFIATDYYFNGVPILMVISPEGKTLLRGYSDIYQPLKDLLEKEIGK